MLHETAFYAKLDSTLYGSLAQAVETTAAAIGAEVAAGRVFNAPAYTQAVYVTTGRLRALPEHHAALEAWLSDPGSLFDFIRQREPAPSVYRPCEIIDELDSVPTDFFRRIQTLCPVNDTIFLTVDMGNPVWAALAFIRCHDQPLFDDAQLQTLDRFLPAITRLLRLGYQREMSRRQPTAADFLHAGHPVGAHEMIGRLSRTERTVLEHLRADLTEPQVAHAMKRSRHTIHVHVKSIYRKLGVRSRKQLLTIFAQAHA